MQRTLNLEVANFICKFGEKINLLDRFEEIVKPAFLSEYERTYRDTTYLFLDVSIEYLEPSNLDSAAIVGRMVKDTVLERQQVFDRKTRGLVPDRRKLNTAPSSVFALLLSAIEKEDLSALVYGHSHLLGLYREPLLRRPI